ncbi:putative adenosine monophosphate-protein transferase fic (plasmid) [Piscirickettsia salmonis]|uniref:hypothetical protein n=1 Tax=Piscirickettsia salmonis TaxID=1238 RepID=UPI0012BAE96C|nr:hypothetical protein [Piscirickettsia salmonis]QGP57400.1 putative adenosine monophosphate-protein transferase fic [Piscirickettsia salmonis]QGP66995.1 putative adenosine monophosphate-protein transferase fic [Piscirickettsia salmonis]
MHDKYGLGQDPYCYPNTDVLKNKLNITSLDELEEAEFELVLVRMESLDFDVALTLKGLQKIHYHLFQDLI